MKSLAFSFILSISIISCYGQEVSGILYSEFEDWILNMDVRKLTNTTATESNQIFRLINNIMTRTQQDPNEFTATDYLEAMVMLLIAKADYDMVEMAFDKMIEKEGNCDYIIKFYDDLMKYDLYKPIRSKWSERYQSCENGVEVIINEQVNLRHKAIKPGDFDLFEIGILEVNPGHNKAASEFSKSMVSKMPIGVSKKLFISQNRFVEVDLFIHDPKSFILYDYDIQNGTLSIYIEKEGKRIRAEIQQKHSLKELLNLDESNATTDDILTKSLKALNTYQVDNFETDSVGYQIVPGYPSNKYIHRDSANSQSYEEYWGLVNIPSIKDYIKEDVSPTFLPIKFYSIDEFLEIKGGIHSFTKDIDLSPEYKISKDDYALVSWKDFIKELKS